MYYKLSIMNDIKISVFLDNKIINNENERRRQTYLPARFRNSQKTKSTSTAESQSRSHINNKHKNRKHNRAKRNNSYSFLSDYKYDIAYYKYDTSNKLNL